MFGYLYPGGERYIADPTQSQLIESPKNLLNAFPIWYRVLCIERTPPSSKAIGMGPHCALYFQIPLSTLPPGEGELTYSLVKRVLELLEKFDRRTLKMAVT
ncbi:uncharacterized protein ACHE_40519A [Aspergillus chevalieri]|uniref:Uncharacterized protein n=1 Tax=Aspergillus chevalieri TaxID=182096 RepID=A0A7R7VNP3_ASPCH|nr:uncharacterized protein ACHE_40519A [Aspergillus chevalieri]BCR87955.1 hypothetical protein ACHE_40519A [Aspergillus chevalieri]